VVADTNDKGIVACQGIFGKMKLLLISLYYILAYNLPHQYYPLGKYSSKLRSYLVRKILGHNCGQNINIQGKVLLGKFDDIKIGSNTAINENCRLRNANIGSNVLIAPEVYILHSGHGYSDLSIPINMQGETHYSRTNIADNVWIGARCIILPGRSIGSGAIIAAGSVVVNDVVKNSIVGGNPAKLIKYRK
jgi:maltose O-acetyltransferase